jgi:hypothetical protein
LQNVDKTKLTKQHFLKKVVTFLKNIRISREKDRQKCCPTFLKILQHFAKCCQKIVDETAFFKIVVTFLKNVGLPQKIEKNNVPHF